jgi:hypothetical protein
MLWCEKIAFVKETSENWQKYFGNCTLSEDANIDYYGWCDIGYFRNRSIDLNTAFLSNWGKSMKDSCHSLHSHSLHSHSLHSHSLHKDKIHYACINNSNGYISTLVKMINNKNALGLPIQPIPPYQNSIAGGFFILHRENIDWWFQTFDAKLRLYLMNNYLVKDDQIILADCIFSLDNQNKFMLFRENDDRYDNWFMFQRVLNAS